jgi:plastocyanin domain-containing protein
MFYSEIFKALNRGKVEYVVVGGIAVNLHGFLRVTADLDLVISLKSSNVEKFISVIGKLGWKPKIPVKLKQFADPKQRNSWIKEKGMKAFNMYNPKRPFEELDILIDSPVNYSKAVRTQQVVIVENIKVPIMSINDLLKLKRAAGRVTDRRDIEALIQIRDLKNEKKKKYR